MVWFTATLSPSIDSQEPFAISSSAVAPGERGLEEVKLVVEGELLVLLNVLEREDSHAYFV